MIDAASLPRYESPAAQLFHVYSAKLTALAEKNLTHRLAQRLDGEDVVQSVFRTFFVRSARGEFRIKNSVEFCQLLVRITLTKARDQARRHTSGKRDVNAEARGVEEWMLEAFTAEPGPLGAAAFFDQIETILEGLPDAYGEILALRLEGRSRTVFLNNGRCPDLGPANTGKIPCRVAWGRRSAHQ